MKTDSTEAGSTVIDSTVCKFVCTEVAALQFGGQRVKLAAQYDPNLPEDRRFNKASPSGTFEVYVDNPSVHGFFTPGKAYYLNITAVEEAGS